MFRKNFHIPSSCSFSEQADKGCRYLWCFQGEKISTHQHSYSETLLFPWQICSGILLVDVISGFDQTNFPEHLLASSNSKTMDVVIIFSLKWVNICKIPEDDTSLREWIHLLLQLEESSVRKKSLKLPCSVASCYSAVRQADSTSLSPRSCASIKMPKFQKPEDTQQCSFTLTRHHW